jgi:predicted small secreted protein
MKKTFRSHIFIYLLAAGLAGTQIGCSTDTKKTETTTAGNESETAYNDFRGYVSSVESSTTDSANWQSASTQSRQEYDAKVAALDQYNTDYDEARRQEIEALKGRYNTYWDQQLARYNAEATSVNGGVAADYRTEGLATTSAADIRKAYESLITRIQSNKDSYTKEDWKAINNYYISLDDRKNAVQSELSDKDKLEIGKAKAKYVALRTAARFDPDVSKAASDVENTAENVGSDIKEGAKTGAQKVGNAAEKAGSEVKAGAKNLRNKVDSKVDNDPEIR